MPNLSADKIDEYLAILNEVTSYKTDGEKKKMEKLSNRNAKPCAWFNRRRLMIMGIILNVLLVIFVALMFSKSASEAS